MTLRAWLRQPASRWWIHLLLWPLVSVFLLFVAALVFEYGPEAWDWLTEDLGARLRRECESVAREALPAHVRGDRSERETYIRQCVDSRARLVR